MTGRQTDLRERELDYWMARAYEAEGKLWRAEKRLAEWMEHWNATARTGAVDEIAAILEANARADQAEARIKAVQDALDVDEHVTKQMGTLGQWRPYVPAIAHDTIRRALDG